MGTFLLEGNGWSGTGVRSRGERSLDGFTRWQAILLDFGGHPATASTTAPEGPGWEPFAWAGVFPG